MLLVLLSCTWPLPTNTPPPRTLPDEAPGTGMRAPFVALEPASRLGAPLHVERRSGWLPPLVTVLSLWLTWRRAPRLAPVYLPLQRPSLVSLQQLKLEGG